MECTKLEITDIVEQLPRNLKGGHAQMRLLATIEKIVVHYDAVNVPSTPDGTPEYNPVARYIEQARYHMKKNWNEGGGQAIRGFGLMYHYRVSSDGRIWRTQPEGLVTWHARAANNTGLAICCDLGPDQQPTETQLAGLKSILDWLCTERPDIPTGRTDVWGHGELRKEGNRTPCPGALMAWVQAYRAG